VTAGLRPRRRRRVWPLLLGLVLLALVFAAGLAVGQALEDNPRPGGTQTSVRTLPPLDAVETVTVTVSNP
jgi:hypothetical protein